MKLTFLGTGSLPTVGKRNPMSILLKTDKKTFLLDCGSGSLVKMAEKNIDFLNLNAIFVTHVHMDHINDIVSIVGSMILTGRRNSKKLRKVQLLIRGSKEVLGAYVYLRKLIPVPDNFKIDKRVFKKEEKIGNVIIETIPIDHFAEKKTQAFALKFNVGGKSVVYSGDIDWTENIKNFIEFSKNSDLLIIDGGRAIGVEGNIHLNPFQISQIARDANPKKLIVVHLTDIDTPAEIKDAISEFYSGDILIARDGMTLTV